VRIGRSPVRVLYVGKQVCKNVNKNFSKVIHVTNPQGCENSLEPEKSNDALRVIVNCRGQSTCALYIESIFPHHRKTGETHNRARERDN
jgi:hypothetical protein